MYGESPGPQRLYIPKLRRHPAGFGGVQHSYTSAHILNQCPALTATLLSSIQNGQNTNQIRYISFSPINFEQASSKVEETVKQIQEKEKVKDALKSPIADAATISKITAATGPATSAAPVPTENLPVKSGDKRTIMQKIKHEILHYYHGFRLLFIDINVARILLGKVLNGKTLTRREYRLLIRTTGDVFRLLPFSVFIIVPFMEFLLPVFIKFFPGMLPSTFETAKDKEVKALSNLKVKLEMAKFLQKTLDEMDVQHKDHSSEEARDFIKFFNRLRTSGGQASSEEIMKFSKLFEDEITLDSLSRPQLTAICKVLEVGSLGTSNFLRFQLRMKLRTLAADDRMIHREGVESLLLSELQSACRARGMRAYGVSEPQLKSQLSEWINLSLNEKVPPSLLLLSRAMMLPENVPTVEKLKASISVLSEAAAIQTKAAIGEREGKIDNATQIEIIRDEQRKIKEELEELKEVEKETVVMSDTLRDTAKIISADDTPAISNKELEVVCDALHAISKDNKTHLFEKEEIRDLKEEIADYKEDVAELQEVSKTADVSAKIRESHASKRLLKKVDAMISRLDNVLADLEKKEKRLQAETIGNEVKHPDLVQIDEVMYAIRKVCYYYILSNVLSGAFLSQTAGLLNTAETNRAFISQFIAFQMKKVSDESKMEQIYKMLEKIDNDRDGQLKVDDVLKVNIY